MKKIPLICLSLGISLTLFSQKRLILEEGEFIDYSNQSAPYLVDSIVFQYTPGWGTLTENEPKLRAERGENHYKYSYLSPELNFTTKNRYKGPPNSTLILSGTGTKTYNSSYQLTEFEENTYRENYTYDPNGNVLEIEREELDGANWEFDSRLEFSYDAQNRVIEKKTYFNFGQGIVLQFHDSLWYDGNSNNCSAIKYWSPNLVIKVITTFSGDTPLSFNKYSNGTFSSTGTYYSSNGHIDSLIIHGVNSSGIPSSSPSFSEYYTYNASGKLTSDSLYNHFYNSILLEKYSYDNDNFLTDFKKYRTNPMNSSQIFNERNYKFTYENVAGVEESSIYFTCYPNPAQNELFVSTTDEIKYITVYDMEGKILLNQNSNKVDISHIPSGCYKLVVTTNAGIAEQSFIKL